MDTDGFFVGLGGIAFVAVESIFGVVTVIDGHHPVPGDFGDNTGGCDGSTPAVAFFNSFLWQVVWNFKIAVDQQVIRLGLKVKWAEGATR